MYDLATAAWLTQFGVIRSEAQREGLLRIQTGKLAAYAFHGADPARIQAASDLLAWLFIFDDFHADGPYRRDTVGLRERHRAMQQVLTLQDNISSDDPFVAGLAELYVRLRAFAPKQWLVRLSHDIEGFFRGCETETRFREEHMTPSIDEYLAYRDYSVGVYIVFDLVELATNFFLDAERHATPAIQDICRIANLVSAITNDIFSARKEALEDATYNIVSVIARQNVLPLKDAVFAATELHARLLDEYHHQERAILAESAELQPLRVYFEGIREWMHGNHQWSTEVPRYNDVPAEGWEFFTAQTDADAKRSRSPTPS